MKIFPQSIQTLEQALSTATLKQRVHAANIANVDTPNYKSKQVDFQSVLNSTMNNQAFSSFKTNAKHLSFSGESTQLHPSIKVNNSSQYSPNGNNVDMDYEMSNLAKNQLFYNAVTEGINGKFNNLRTVINGGR